MAVRDLSRRLRRHRSVVAAIVLVLVAGLLVVGTMVWKRATRGDLEEALELLPASSLRVGFTDWKVVRQRLQADVGDTPDRDAVEGLMQKAYDSDYAAASSIDESAAALQSKFGFSPATAQWEAFAQGREGAAMVLKVADGSDFDVLAGNLRAIGYDRPKEDDGVWQGGADLVVTIDPTISPELQYVVLLADQGLVVSSDNAAYAASAAKVASGDADSFAEVDGVPDMAGRLDDPANAMLWGKDFACTDLAMSGADEDAQAQAKTRVQQVGGVTPLAGLAMAMQPDRTLRVVAHFEDSDRAEKNLRPRAKLAVGEAIGRGGSFSDDFELVSSRAVGDDVLLDLRPREKTGFVLSALYDGPLLFATC
ncbi:MAG: hypothetical protein JWR85_2050 [Marmoricola sp.]|nr:hypothetical protein [Marmoricola sp.]